MKKNNITIIFAVTRNLVSVYKELSNVIEGSYVGVLASDSSNIVTLITDQYKVFVFSHLVNFHFTDVIINLAYLNYQQITSHLELKDNAPSNVKVTYYSKCLR